MGMAKCLGRGQPEHLLLGHRKVRRWSFSLVQRMTGHEVPDGRGGVPTSDGERSSSLSFSGQNKRWACRHP